MMDDRLTTEVVTGVYLMGAPRERRMYLENPNLPLNSPEIWEEVFGDMIGTDSGITVNEDKALMYAPVWQAVTLIASSVACLPFHHFRRLPDISETASERLTSTQDYLVSVSPSGGVEPDDYCTAVQFWESFMVDALLWGNAYALVVYDGAGRPIQLRLLNPDRTNAEMINGRLWYVTEYNVDGTPKLKALYPWEVVHVKGVCPYGNQAPRFIKYARNSIALGLAQQKFAASFFRHGGRVGGILELPAGMPKMARDTIEEGFRRTYEDPDRPFQTVILRESAKFHAAQTSPHDAQMVDASEGQVRMIARWFGLAPAMLGVPGSASYNSKEQDNQSFLDHCLKRWLRKIEAECGIKLLSAARQQSEFFAHDVSDLVSLDAAKQAQAHQIYRQMGVLSANEIRGKLNLLPREGGDDYGNPATTPGTPPDAAEPASEQEPAKAADGNVEDAKEAVVEGNAKQVGWKEQRVLFHLTHVARQKAKNARAFEEWVDGGFATHRAEWRELSPGIPEPEFFHLIGAELQTVLNTVTPAELPAKVLAITTTYEQGVTDGTQID